MKKPTPKAKESRVLRALWRSSFGGHRVRSSISSDPWTHLGRASFREWATFMVWFEAMTASISPASNVHFTSLMGPSYLEWRSHQWNLTSGFGILGKQEHCYLDVYGAPRSTLIVNDVSILNSSCFNYMSSWKTQRIYLWGCMFQIMKKKEGGTGLDQDNHIGQD